MVDITATYIDHMGSDLSVVNAARVSFGKKSTYAKDCFNCGEKAVKKYPNLNLWECGSCYIDIDQKNMKLSDRDTKLIRYLAKHKHISPFGHAFASFHVKAPVFVARQLVKHKFLRWNEISRRYVDDEPEFYVPDVWRGRSADKKQGSDGVISISDDIVEDLYDDAVARYRLLLEIGVCPEQARMVLPQSMMTEWYWSGSLDAFASLCHLRCKPDTQYESQLVANQIDKEMAKLFPVSWAALRGEE